MSHPQTPGSASRPEKTMSSRLLTMKFMQRAAAASASSTPIQTPTRPPVSTQTKSPLPSSPKPVQDDPLPSPSSKRQKFSNGTHSPSPISTPQSTTSLTAIDAALAAEEHLRHEAVLRQACDAGETEWVLKFDGYEPQVNIHGGIQARERAFIQTGYGAVDDEAVGGYLIVEDDEDDGSIGRRTYGGFKRKREVAPDESSSHSDEDSDSESDRLDDDDLNDPTAALIRESRMEAIAKAKEDRKAKKRAEKAESIKLAQERKQNHQRVNLNKLKSISGGGQAQTAQTCFVCGERGHLKKDCPRTTSKRN